MAARHQPRGVVGDLHARGLTHTRDRATEAATNRSSEATGASRRHTRPTRPEAPAHQHATRPKEVAPRPRGDHTRTTRHS
eukprot:12314886-Alexandrium_andersonii.AAC.1